MEETNQKEIIINNLNDEYKSILEEYSIESTILGPFNVTNYDYIRDLSCICYDKNNEEQKKDVYENNGDLFINIYLQNNSNDTIKILHWVSLDYGEESTYVIYNKEILLKCKYNSYNAYFTDGIRLYKDILEKLGIPLYIDNLILNCLAIK